MPPTQFDEISLVFSGILGEIERSVLDSISGPLVSGDETTNTLIARLQASLVAAVNASDIALAEAIQRIIDPMEIRLIQAEQRTRELEQIVIASAQRISDETAASMSLLTQNLNTGFSLQESQFTKTVRDLETSVTEQLEAQNEEAGRAFTFFGIKIGETFNKTLDAIDDATAPIMQSVTEIIPGFGGLLEGLIVPLISPITDFFSNPSSIFTSLLETVITGPLSKQLGIGAEQIDEFIVGLESDEDVGSIVKQFTGGGVISVGVIGLVFLAMAAQAVASGVIGASMSGALQNLTKRSNRTFHPTILTVGEFQESLRRGIAFATEARDDMRDQGFTEERIEALTDLSTTLLPAAENIELWRRENLSDTELIKRLGQLGFDNVDTGHLQTLAFAIPGVSDIIRMAVREVFTPEIAEKFGQFEDIPEDFIKWAKVGGLSEDWARNFWAAHWELPSVGQAFEMFHRTTDDPIDDDADTIKLPSGATTANVIGRATMEALLRAQDVMPFWRDKITAIAFRPLTRVDVRRMHKLGVLSNDQVFRNYLDLGYAPDNAQRLLDFTIEFNRGPDTVDIEEARNLTRTQVLNFLEDGLLTEQEALADLQEIGFSVEHSVTIIEGKLLDISRDLRKLKVATVRERFINGMIDFNEATEQLAPLGLGDAQTQKVLADMEGIRQSKVRIPTRADVDNFITAGIIAEDEYISVLHAIGYVDPWPQRYLELALKG